MDILAKKKYGVNVTISSQTGLLHLWRHSDEATQAARTRYIFHQIIRRSKWPCFQTQERLCVLENASNTIGASSKWVKFEY